MSAWLQRVRRVVCQQPPPRPFQEKKPAFLLCDLLLVLDAKVHDGPVDLLSFVRAQIRQRCGCGGKFGPKRGKILNRGWGPVLFLSGYMFTWTSFLYPRSFY